MRDIVLTCLERGAREASAARKLVLVRALQFTGASARLRRTAREASRTDLFACIQALPGSTLLDKASPFFWLNTRRAHGLDDAAAIEGTQLTSHHRATAFDAFFDELPDGLSVTVRSEPRRDLVLPSLGLTAFARRRPIELTRISDGEVLVVDGRGERRLRVGAKARRSARVAPIPGSRARVLSHRAEAFFEREYREQISDGDVAARSFARDVADGLDLIGLADPALRLRIERAIGWYVPIHRPDARTHNSFTSAQLQGVILLSRARSKAALAEAIVHEFGHTELNVLLDTQPIAHPDGERRYYSPWRPDPRPLLGLLHALFVWKRVARFVARLTELRGEPGEQAELRQRLRLTLARLRLGLAQVPDGRLTDLGRRLIADVASSMESLEATGGVLRAEEQAVIRDHRASFAARHARIKIQGSSDNGTRSSMSKTNQIRTRTSAPIRSEEPVSFLNPVRLRMPFRHFLVPGFMRPRVATELLQWFEGDAPWQRHRIKSFYDTYDMLLQPAILPDSLKFLCHTQFLDCLRTNVGRLLGAELDPHVHVAAHKMVPGFRMGVHSDFGETKQAFRLLVQLNRGWQMENGGLLLFLDQETPTKISKRQRYYVPEHRLGIGFEISAKSFHGVSEVVSGDRYTLRISFYRLGETD